MLMQDNKTAGGSSSTSQWHKIKCDYWVCPYTGKCKSEGVGCLSCKKNPNSKDDYYEPIPAPYVPYVPYYPYEPYPYYPVTPFYETGDVPFKSFSNNDDIIISREFANT